MAAINHWRWGGFVISPATATDWASRITGKELDVSYIGTILNAIEAKVRPFKAEFKVIGDTWEDLKFMVVTRSERLIDYQEGSPVPQFEEGEKVTRAKPLLEREGLTDYVFMTVHKAI